MRLLQQQQQCKCCCGAAGLAYLDVDERERPAKKLITHCHKTVEHVTYKPMETYQRNLDPISVGRGA